MLSGCSHYPCLKVCQAHNNGDEDCQSLINLSFADFMKAFDTIHQVKMLGIMKAYVIPDYFFNR